ncbi:MAG: L-2-hydroxyglutarate oxidase [bacterium]|nr:L-2-hydroxyglutarate oxidase [bacterium]
MNIKTDITIIGGGLIGLATAYRIHEFYPNLSIRVIEKEETVAKHQSGSNSGVIHTGIYYKPGSLKAENCKNGKIALERFCMEHHIRYQTIGKLIVATDESELPTLNDILKRGKENGVRCSSVGPEFIKEAEPHACGIQGIYVPDAGIVDYPRIAEKLKQLIEHKSGAVMLGTKLIFSRKSTSGLHLTTSKGEIETKYVINCAGLYSDKVAHMLGFRPNLKIIPFRGEYYSLKADYRHLCKALLYPVPNMNFPFLGVHFTKRISGEVECGPNAVLAFKREGYTKLDINFFELFESLTYSGFLKLSSKFWREGWNEIKRSYSKTLFTKALQKLIPEVQEDYLEPGGSGVRAQAIAPDGKMLDDFVIQEDERTINVLNAPSPGATSCLNIGSYIATRLGTRFS